MMVRNEYQKQKQLRRLFLGLIAFVSVVSTNCDYTFDPLLENDQFYYSMYGFLNTSQDTQWIRISPIRESLFLDELPIDATVTLTKNSNGQTVQLRDSLFEFYPTPEDVVTVRNYYTDWPIEFGEEYTLRAERSDGRVSSATTTVPGQFDPPTFSYNPNTQGGVVNGNVPGRLIVADVLYHVTVVDENRVTIITSITVSQFERDNVVIQENGDYKIDVNDRKFIGEQFAATQQNVQIDSAEIFIAIGGYDWPDTSGQSLEESALPQSATNVSSGTGLVLGVASLTMPYESCYDASNVLIPCPPKNTSSKIAFSFD